MTKSPTAANGERVATLGDHEDESEEAQENEDENDEASPRQGVISDDTVDYIIQSLDSNL